MSKELIAKMMNLECRFFSITHNGLQLHAVAEALDCAVGAIACRCCYTLPLLLI
jgi:hypothetical protein